jgi:predicted HicB family RNase H-like nuclease
MSDSDDKDEVKPLSLRDFPEDLYWKCKEMAARRRVSLKHYVIEALEQAVERDSKKTRPI